MEDNDIEVNGSNLNMIIGTSETDVLIGTSRADQVLGGAGDDTLTGQFGNDVINGQNGSDEIFGGVGADTLSGGAGDDTLEGGAGDDTLVGGAGNDRLRGDGGDDQLDGGAGEDTFFYEIGDGNDNISSFNAAEDRISFASANLSSIQDAFDKATQDGENVVFDFGDSGTLTVTGTTIEALTNSVQISELPVISGSADSDVIRGAGLAEKLAGRAGEDTIFGNAGDDRIAGQSGNDTLNGDAGDDHIFGGAGDDIIIGGDGSDRLNGGAGNDILNGGAGDDRLLGGAGNDTYIFEADSGNDTIISFNSANDQIELTGFGFASVEDALNSAVQQGNNIVFNFSDENSLTIRNTTLAELAEALQIVDDPEESDDTDGPADLDPDVIDMLNQIVGTSADESIQGTSQGDNIDGLTGNDVISSGSGNDRVLGQEGDDTLSGGTGDDVLFGGDGRDFISGQRGNDIILGGAGDDLLFGGAGDDIFDGGEGIDKIAIDPGMGRDIIVNFADNEDILEFDNITDAAARAVIDSATEEDGDVIFDLGDGNSVTVEDITFEQLRDDIIIDFGGDENIPLPEFLGL